ALGRGDLGTIQYPQVGAIAKELGLFIPSLGMEGMKDYSLAEQLAVAGALRADGTMPSLELLRQLAAQDRFATLAGATTFQSSGGAYSSYAESAVALARSAFLAGFSARDVRSFLGQLRNDFSLKQVIADEISEPGGKTSVAGRDFDSWMAHLSLNTDLLSGGIQTRKGPYLLAALDILNRFVEVPNETTVYRIDFRSGGGNATPDARVALSPSGGVFSVPLSVNQQLEIAQGVQSSVQSHLSNLNADRKYLLSDGESLFASKLLGDNVLYRSVGTNYGVGGGVFVKSRRDSRDNLKLLGSAQITLAQGGGEAIGGETARERIVREALSDIDRAVQGVNLNQAQRLWLLGQATQALEVVAGGFVRGGAGLTDLLAEAAREVITGKRSGKRLVALDLAATTVTPGQFVEDYVSGNYFNSLASDLGGEGLPRTITKSGSEEGTLRSPGADGYSASGVGGGQTPALDPTQVLGRVQDELLFRLSAEHIF
ncbi:MAG: hypothetical protein ACK5PF_02955, partial [bacterium]